MRLQRIQVPDFKVLKNVDISFEKDFVPNIFPIGSQNGGGKSTLLQLIFVLLHCSVIDQRKHCVQNLLYGFDIPNNTQEKILAVIEIWDGEKRVELTFLSHSDYFYPRQIDNDSLMDIPLKLSDLSKLELFKQIIPNLELEIKELQKSVQELEFIRNTEDVKERNNHFQNVLKNINWCVNVHQNEFISTQTINQLIENIYLRLAENHKKLLNYYENLKNLEQNVTVILKNLQFENLLYICNYASELDNCDTALLCKVNNLEIDEAKLFLERVSQKVFLAAPTTQIFLFFPYGLRKILLRNQKQYDNYYSLIGEAKDRLPGLFTYDFLAVDLLIEAFKSSRDKDFREAIDKGEYGNNYKTLIQNLNNLLGDKTIKLDADFSGITFQVNRDGTKIQLNPEDLSHGELKRLSIYMWIKFKNIEDAIVLMDEIEIAFHPDWQYQIISDLYQWSPTNQYILATHSYELCQALTPAHVKELDPKLLKPETKNQV